MRVKGALHVHSTLSRDGSLTIEEIARWYRRNGYHFVAMGEHAEDLNDAKVQALREQSGENSSETFCVIPGIEFVGSNDVHVVGIGAVSLIHEGDPVPIVREIHAQGGLAILAHPKRIGWKCPADVLLAVDAAEIWNIVYDGKYLPSAKALNAFRKMRQINPKLLAVASHDFHRTASFYDVAVEMDVEFLSREAILGNLRRGCYSIRSRFFRADAEGRVSKVNEALLRLFSQQLSRLRKARSAILRSAP